MAGKVALVTGGANGIGAAVAGRLAERGSHLVLADVDDKAGAALAKELDGIFVHADVREPADSEKAVAAAVEHFGGLDIAHLNAGVSTGCSIGDDFDLDTYRRAMAINLDGVVFGVQAVLPALRLRGGGEIVATASMAGLVSVPLDPIYAANKHAVVGLVRSLGELLGPEGIAVNGLCPSFAATGIITGIRPYLEEVGFPILEVEAVVDAFIAILESGESGQCWFVVPGRESEPFRFRNAPGPR
ncbi:MAG: SDR family NAD(P)-dependent oxidoreductase [Acidimicrobiales bacterium]